MRVQSLSANINPIYYGKANSVRKSRGPLTVDVAEAVAIQALNFIAGDGERLGRFLATTGLGPTEIRAAAHESEFLAGVLEYLEADERLITAFAAEQALDPTDVTGALIALRGPNWEREVP